MKKLIFTVAALSVSLLGLAQVKVTVHDGAKDQPVIPAEIYGQFSEHLGKCIYEGIWVGPDSSIPNVDGYRTDVLEALKTLKVPVLRWPGGCFADEYHWMDGIGPKENRPKLVNNNWGSTLEDNSFGTHEFLNLCEMLGTEPYISGNIGSGTVEELAKWIEYMTADAGSMAELRKQNGRDKPWKVKYLGVGNETWGCGGDMTAEYYSDVYKRYALYSRNYSGNRLYKVACGASDYDYDWTKIMMTNARDKMNGLSLHYYTCKGWVGSKGSATQFTPDEYYNTLAKAVEIDEVLDKHIAIMDALDPQGRVGLLLDEWGTWFDVEPGTNPGWLFQQNTMRDALVASMSLDIFNKKTRRLAMANIAQIVNVLQAMILTDGDKMLLTPTYHVFRMYNVHQDATAVPVEYKADSMTSQDGRPCPLFSASSSKDANGVIHISLSNPSLDKDQTVEISMDDLRPGSVTGEILTSANISDHNEFGKSVVEPKPFGGAKVSGKTITLTLPKASVVVLAVK